MSTTRDAIRAISKGPCAAVLAPAGFRRSAPHYWREVGGVNHAINFQASAFGSQDEGRFTVNLGISTPELYQAFIEKPLPSNRGTALWPIQVRIGDLVGAKKDLWWDVTPTTDVETVGRQVADTLRDYALPFFERFSSPTGIAEFASNRPRWAILFLPAQVPLVLAILDAQRGDLAAAYTRLAEAIRECHGHPFEDTIRRVGRRLGLDMDL